ncbi:MAG: hypothetical protein K6A30_02980 [Lachnospiraceae bacterium]|nr:hypothetical protein [Lachnospiraceae bacterium]
MGYSIDATRFLHRYEAYRLPEEAGISKENRLPQVTEKKDGKDEENPLILTEKAKKLMEKDRELYSSTMMLQQQQNSARQEDEAMKKYVKDLDKIMKVFRNMAKGDLVSPADEKKLMDYNMELYEAAKMAQTIARNEKSEAHDSEWDPEEEDAYKELSEGLRSEGEEMRKEYPDRMSEFSEMQKSNIVEVDISV